MKTLKHLGIPLVAGFCIDFMVQYLLTFDKLYPLYILSGILYALGGLWVRKYGLAKEQIIAFLLPLVVIKFVGPFVNPLLFPILAPFALITSLAGFWLGYAYPQHKTSPYWFVFGAHILFVGLISFFYPS